MRARSSHLLVLVALAPVMAAAQTDSVRPFVYSRATEAQLDSLYAPLGYFMHRDEQGVYPGLTLAGKRDYLERFWARRNPTPGATDNKAADAYNGRLAYVNGHFHEGDANGTATPGWRTDRGRIYLENGPADITLSASWPAVPLPFTVWKYIRGGKIRKYCFVDLTLFGTYVLVYSTEGHETTRPDWPLLVGEDAAQDILNF
ncbi:MAG TPA: GWxTD domain-containing protein [Gemmatimonadales bacterium]|nr:GWxTD domain-containing protein [Gemmatimonadales bacterium]